MVSNSQNLKSCCCKTLIYSFLSLSHEHVQNELLALLIFCTGDDSRGASGGDDDCIKNYIHFTFFISYLLSRAIYTLYAATASLVDQENGEMVLCRVDLSLCSSCHPDAVFTANKMHCDIYSIANTVFPIFPFQTPTIIITSPPPLPQKKNSSCLDIISKSLFVVWKTCIYKYMYTTHKQMDINIHVITPLWSQAQRRMQSAADQTNPKYWRKKVAYYCGHYDRWKMFMFMVRM